MRLSADQTHKKMVLQDRILMKKKNLKYAFIERNVFKNTFKVYVFDAEMVNILPPTRVIFHSNV